jgi:transcription elongation factor GreB
VLEVCYERISVEPFREPPGSEASAKRSLADANPPDEKETKRHRW